MGKTLTYLSHAKINWFLSVHSPPHDSGYHTLDSVMQRITLADKISFARQNDNAFSLTITKGDCHCTPEKNIIRTTVDLFHDITGIPCNIAISLEKYIPVGAGLGGGSSNAATVLTALNTLYNEPLSAAELHICAARLGADVPFFLSSPCAICSHFGDQCKPLCPQHYALVLWKPHDALLTQQVYHHFDAVSRPVYDSDPFIKAYTSRSFGMLKNSIKNNLAHAAEELMPRLSTMKTNANDVGAVCAWISGSGPTCVALAHDDAHAHAIAEKLTQKYADSTDFITVTHTLT